MTTQATALQLEPEAAPASSALQTGPIEPTAEGRAADSLMRLDHRTRSRAVAQRLARRGPHLAVGQGLQTRLIALEDKITHVGRGLTADIRIEDQGVSRTHAIIVRHGRHARILDNRSSNGTYLNGRRVVATNLQNGDMIWIGPVAMQYVEIG
jgi:pSer/pThr/pTyr-binding forkhead associated (FHA) protein